MAAVFSKMEFVVAHGSSKFLKPERVAALKRQDKNGTSGLFQYSGIPTINGEFTISRIVLLHFATWLGENIETTTSCVLLKSRLWLAKLKEVPQLWDCRAIGRATCGGHHEFWRFTILTSCPWLWPGPILLKKEMIQMSIYFPPNPYCQTKASWREDLSRVADESPGALTTPMRQCVGIPDHVFQYYVTASCGKPKHKPPPHVAY